MASRWCGCGEPKSLAERPARLFAYRLAVRLGRLNVDAMLRNMTIRQFDEWREYADLEPWDEERADVRAASIVRAVVNAHRGKGRRAVSLKECIVKFGKPKRQTPEQVKAEVLKVFDYMAATHGPGPQKKGSR